MGVKGLVMIGTKMVSGIGPNYLIKESGWVPKGIGWRFWSSGWGGYRFGRWELNWDSEFWNHWFNSPWPGTGGTHPYYLKRSLGNGLLSDGFNLLVDHMGGLMEG